jgi:hypothetical protein
MLEVYMHGVVAVKVKLNHFVMILMFIHPSNQSNSPLSSAKKCIFAAANKHLSNPFAMLPACAYKKAWGIKLNFYTFSDGI